MPRRRAPVRIREIRERNDPALRRVYRFFQRIFPRGELVPFRDWADSIREREAGLWTDLGWHVLVAELQGRVIGAATGNYLGNLNIGIIGYIAVGRGDRAHGLGARLRRRLREMFEQDARRMRRRSLDALVGEVHPRNPWLRHLVRRERAIALDFLYYQPALRGEPAVPLVLYYQPLRRSRRTVAANELRRLLYTMWRRAYRVPRPLSRREFRRMLGALAGRSRIGQRT